MDIAVTVTLPHYTNLPTDITVNTFAIQADNIGQLSGPVMLAIDSFYNDEHAASTSIAELLSAQLLRTSSAVLVDFYDIDAPSPRVPIYSSSLTLGAAGGSDNLPNEVALCVSWAAPAVSGVPQARRRGRIFLGPFTELAGNPGDATSPARPSTTTVGAVAAAAESLASDLATAGTPLCVWSRTNGSLAEVTHGWVDNDWDTQRRRSTRASDRTVWSLST